MSDAPKAPSPYASAVPNTEVDVQGVEILSVHSSGFIEALSFLGTSLAVSTYQAGKVILVRNDAGELNTHFVDVNKPMGIAVGKNQLAVGATGEILFYQNVPDNLSKLTPDGKHDACFVQRYGHLTGEIDIHEMAFGDDGQIWFINTRFSALCTLRGSTSFMPVWRPSFVSCYAPEDRCHLNGLALFKGQPRFVTALGQSDSPAGWRETKADGGVLIDLATSRIVSQGLSMPHSPRWYGNQLWVCESGRGTLSKVDLVSGEVTPVCYLPGFTRGLDFAGPYAFVGLSRIRETATFSGIPIAEKAKERNCGIWIIDLRNGEVAGILRFTQGVEEIFAVQALPGMRFPEMLDKYSQLALESYFIPPEVIREVRLTPSVQRAYGDAVPAPAQASHQVQSSLTRPYSQ